MPKSTTKPGTGKPRKPNKDFPLFAHGNGQWGKKIRGRIHFFGVWREPEKALNKWLDEKDDLLAGRTPRGVCDGLTVRLLLNHFLTAKEQLVKSAEIAPTTFAEYHQTCERIGKVFGLDRLVDDLAANDFQSLREQMARSWGPVRLANQIQRVRSVFKFGYEAGLIEKPVRYGPTFKKPSAKVLRVERQKRGPKMFSPKELRQIIDTAGPQLQAMILLGLNCGFGCTDCATLPQKALELKGGWIDYPRGKTGIDRRCPLWPETIDAIRQSLTTRPEPKEDQYKGLLFVSQRHKSYAQAKQTHWLVSGEMAKLLTKLGLRRPGIGFYTLRHVFQTIADGARDPIAVRAIMGHAASSGDMAAVYRERIDDDRLVAVTEHVRQWLFGKSA